MGIISHLASERLGWIGPWLWTIEEDGNKFIGRAVLHERDPEWKSATVWLLQPLTEEGTCSYGLWLTIGGRMFICQEVFETREAAEAAEAAVREGLR